MVVLEPVEVVVFVVVVVAAAAAAEDDEGGEEVLLERVVRSSLLLERICHDGPMCDGDVGAEMKLREVGPSMGITLAHVARYGMAKEAGNALQAVHRAICRSYN